MFVGFLELVVVVKSIMDHGYKGIIHNHDLRSTMTASSNAGINCICFLAAGDNGKDGNVV
jgi:hypothetical protein